MTLEEVKELMNKKNVFLREISEGRNIKKDIDELSNIEKYKVIGSCFGAVFYEKEIYSTPQILKIVEEEKENTYILIPIR